MTAEIIWLVRGVLAHITVHVEWSETTGRSYSIAWLMGPDGEVCENKHALLGAVCSVGSDGMEWPDRAAVSYAEALAFAREQLKDQWS